jgi:phosphatidylglycerol phospholipase C
VNEENLMRWCLRRCVDGVVTDDPDRFQRICEEWNDDDEDVNGSDEITWRQRLQVLIAVVLVFVFARLFRLKYRAGVERFAEETPDQDDL